MDQHGRDAKQGAVRRLLCKVDVVLPMEPRRNCAPSIVVPSRQFLVACARSIMMSIVLPRVVLVVFLRQRVVHYNANPLELPRASPNREHIRKDILVACPSFRK